MNTLAHEEAYRGEGLLRKIGSVKIVVCGCGAIGSNLVDNMVRQGFKNIRVIDMDRVEDHNRHTQIWDRRANGQLKVTMMKNHAFSAMGVQIEPVSQKLEARNAKKLLQGDLVIDGFDNVESRRLVTDHCRDNGIECLHVGLFMNYAEVAWNDIYNPPQEAEGAQDVCEYPLARNVVLVAVALATEKIIRFLDDGEKSSNVFTLRDMKISPYRG